MLIQRRSNHRQNPVSLRDAGGGLPIITGYAAVFYRAGEAGTVFRPWDDFEERIMPGAFDRTIGEDDVRALFNHRAESVLGRTPNTLKLTVDERGLRYEIEPPDTSTGREVVELIRRGDVSGSSFGFTVRGRTSKVEEGRHVIEVRDVQLFDVGPVTYPAYSGTEAEVRSLGLTGYRDEAAKQNALRDKDWLALQLALMCE